MGRGETLTTKLFMNILNIAHFTRTTHALKLLFTITSRVNICVHMLFIIYTNNGGPFSIMFMR